MDPLMWIPYDFLGIRVIPNFLTPEPSFGTSKIPRASWRANRFPFFFVASAPQLKCIFDGVNLDDEPKLFLRTQYKCRQCVSDDYFSATISGLASYQEGATVV